MTQIYEVYPSGGDDTARLMALRDAILLDPTFSSGGVQIIQPTVVRMYPGIYTISETIDFSFTQDTRLDLHWEGYGRRGTQIYQTDPTKPVFRIATSSGNVRDCILSGLTLLRGSVGIETERSAYNLFERITFDKQYEAGFSTLVSSDEFRGCWFVHGNLCGKVVSGRADIMMGRAGEDIGGFHNNNSTLVLDGFNGHDLKGRRGSLAPSGEQAFFSLTGGGSLIMNGGILSFAEGLNDAVLRTDRCRDITINGTVFEATDMPDFWLGRFHNSGTKPQPGVRMNGRVISTKTDGFNFYRDISGGAIGAPIENALIDMEIQTPSGSMFAWGNEFLVAGNEVSRSTVLTNQD